MIRNTGEKMNKIEIIIVSVLAVIENISFCYAVLKKRIQKTSWEKSVGLAGAALLFVVLLMCGCGYYPAMYIALNAVVIFLMQYMYGMPLDEAVRIWFFLFSFLTIVETVCGSIIEMIELQCSQFLMIFLCSIMVVLLLWLYYFLIGKKIDREKFQLPIRLWVMVEGLLFVYMLMVTYFSHLLQFIESARAVMIGTALVVLGGAGTFGMILAIMYYFNGTAKYKTQSEMAEIYNEQQKDYFLNLLEREEETRKFRHEIFNHLMVIQEFCTEEDVQIKDYIANLLNDRQVMVCRQFDVGNDIVNVIINYYFVPVMEKCNVAVKGHMRELHRISSADLCVVVSNLVKNAAEAASRVKEGKGEIYFFIGEGKRYVKINVKNNYEGEIVFDKKGLPRTGKKESNSHGFGVRNVIQAVEKYEGRCEIRVEDGWYFADVFMKI